MDLFPEEYEQKIGYSRGSLWAPFHAVGMVARIQGDISVRHLEEVLRKLQVLHPPLACRIRMEQDGSAWLTTEGVGGFPLEVRLRVKEEDWINIFLEQERIPFAFDRGPLARFFLLRGEACSDIVVITPHVICDGNSMTQVISDTITLLNDPGRTVTCPSPPPPTTWQSVRHSWSDNLLLRSFIKAVNFLWLKKHPRMGQQDFEAVNQFYWGRRQTGLLAYELSPGKTSNLVARCKQQGVSVTSALIAAIFLSQTGICSSPRSTSNNVTVAVNIRDQMIQPPGRVVGMYASNIDMKLCPKPGITVWELAHEIHARIHKMLKDRSRILWPLALGELKPKITDGLLASLCTDRWERQLRLFSGFVRMGELSGGLDVSNIGKINLPELNMPYRLKNLIPLPPLVPGGGIALNVLTLDDRMNVILKFRLDQKGANEINDIWDRALHFLSTV